ncbi:flagellar FliJ protein [Desulfofundulus australicus DSM 11792]|uniref:Flagellar FliJ protein n=1 Tax=Desulfofundulus australicus DSM 11792 TaxID=1121425 RepID=A0A1M4VL55_9FIRM|nr:flagellar FliJ family protein [Desulfofundulus australicus]SHE69617.1 flagellar FliJ protein [Desulfofundulus australicus DSM 11792]
MRKFRFHLQPVLQFREKKEEQAILAHSRARREYLARVEELHRATGLLEESLAGGGPGPLRPETELHLVLWRERLAGERDRCREEVERASERLMRCRVEAFEARRQRMILETLKEKQLQNHIREENRAEQKETDEQGLRMFWCREGNR